MAVCGRNWTLAVLHQPKTIMALVSLIVNTPKFAPTLRHNPTC